MPTLVMDPVPAEIDALIEHRRRLDLDHYDEVWAGVLHMNPPPTGEHQYLVQYLPIERSTLIDLGQSDLAEQIDWP